MSNYTIEYLLKATDGLTPVLKRAVAQIKVMERSLKMLNKPIKINVDTKQATAAVRKLKAQADKVRAGKKGKKAKDKGIGVGQIAQGATAYLGVKSSLDLGKASTELAKATNLSGAALKELERVAIDVESATGKSAESVMQMMAAASKAGVANKDLASDVLFTTKAAVAFGMSTEDAAESMTNLRSSFFSGQDYETQQAGLRDLAGMISYVADNSASSEPYLAEFIQRAAGIEKTMGASKESITALGATFEAIGIQSEIGSRAVNASGARIAALATDMKALKTLGLNPKAFRKSVEKDVVGAMFDVVKATERMGAIDRSLALKDIFGEGFADELVRMGGALSIYEENLKLVNDKTKQATAFDAAYKIQMDSLNSSVDRASNGFKTLLGVAVAPYLKAVANAAAPVIEFLKNHPTILKMVTAFVALNVALLLVAATMTIFSSGAVVSLLANFKKIVFITRMVTGVMWMLNAAMWANPIGAIILLVVALGVGLYVLYQKSETVREIVDSVGAAFNKAGGFAGIFDIALTGATNTLDKMFSIMRAVIDSVFVLGGAWKNIVSGNFKEGGAGMFSALSGQAFSASKDATSKRIASRSAGLDARQAVRVSGSSPIAKIDPKVQAVKSTVGATGQDAAKSFAASSALQKSSSAIVATAATMSSDASTKMAGAATKQESSGSMMAQASTTMMQAAQQMLDASSRPISVNVSGGLGSQGRG